MIDPVRSTIVCLIASIKLTSWRSTCSKRDGNAIGSDFFEWKSSTALANIRALNNEANDVLLAAGPNSDLRIRRQLAIVSRRIPSKAGIFGFGALPIAWSKTALVRPESSR